MIAFRLRGRGPIASRTSSAVLTLWENRCRLAASMSVPLRREVIEPGLGRLGDRFRVPERGVLPVVDVGDDPRHAFLEAYLGLPAELGRDPADVGPGALGLARALGNIGLLAPEQLDQAI